jgi:hypothetical protein
LIDKPPKKPRLKTVDDIRGFLLADTTPEIRDILPTFVGAGVGADLDQDAVRNCLTLFVDRALRFARLERIFQGDILFDLPVHPAVLEDDFGENPEKEGELLAEEERQILEETPGLLEELSEALDSRGIKVVPVDCPTNAAGLLFRENSGPAILVTRLPESSEGRSAIAHAYGHLVADVSPYRNRFCLLGDEFRPTVEETRAESFAQHLLDPLDLIPDEASEEPPDLHMPARYFNLVLAAYTKGFVEDEGLGNLLEASEEQVRDFLTWARQQDTQED